MEDITEALNTPQNTTIDCYIDGYYRVEGDEALPADMDPCNCFSADQCTSVTYAYPGMSFVEYVVNSNASNAMDLLSDCLSDLSEDMESQGFDMGR